MELLRVDGGAKGAAGMKAAVGGDLRLSWWGELPQVAVPAEDA